MEEPLFVSGSGKPVAPSSIFSHLNGFCGAENL